MSLYRFAAAVSRIARESEKRRAREARERRLVPVLEPIPTTLSACELELADMAIPTPGTDEIEVPGAQALSWLIAGGQVTDLPYIQRCIAALRRRRGETHAA